MKFLLFFMISLPLLFLYFTYFVNNSLVLGIEDRYYDLKNASLDLEEESSVYKNGTWLNMSSSSTDKEVWSPINFGEIEVDEGDNYKIISNMGLNSYAVKSHITIEGLNRSTNEWEQILQCPSGIDGPFETHRFVCNLEVEPNITKIRSEYVQGWSSEDGKEAITYYDNFYIIKAGNNDSLVYDNNLKIEEVIDLSLIDPVTFNFIGSDDILIADKTHGLIYRIINGTFTGPLLDVNVTNNGFFGMNSVKKANYTYVFLYYRESATEIGRDVELDKEDTETTIKPKCNCLYRYELDNDQLINPKLIFALPANLESHSNGGAIALGPDGNIYLATGEIDNAGETKPNAARNFKNGSLPDGSSGILRFTIDGDPVGWILGEQYPLNYYYAYGINNSNGIDFDPLTNDLWDIENGAFYGDEINLVEPGFNSGYNKVTGIWDADNQSIEIANLTGLVNFQGRGNYSSPEFSWKNPVDPLTLVFFNSTELGDKYNNTIFISDNENKFIYNFRLNESRTDLELNESLKDKIADNDEQLSSVVFASGLGTITDIKTGPDGYLYMLSFDNKKLFRVVPN
jgi:aldose sugar dehydrogenase